MKAVQFGFILTSLWSAYQDCIGLILPQITAQCNSVRNVTGFINYSEINVTEHNLMFFGNFSSVDTCEYNMLIFCADKPDIVDCKIPSSNYLAYYGSFNAGIDRPTNLHTLLMRLPTKDNICSLPLPSPTAPYMCVGIIDCYLTKYESGMPIWTTSDISTFSCLWSTTDVSTIQPMSTMVLPAYIANSSDPVRPPAKNTIVAASVSVIVLLAVAFFATLTSVVFGLVIRRKRRNRSLMYSCPTSDLHDRCSGWKEIHSENFSKPTDCAKTVNFDANLGYSNAEVDELDTVALVNHSQYGTSSNNISFPF